MYTNDMKFAETHEWIKIDGSNQVIVGITHHAQELLGDLVYLELPQVGKSVKARDTIGVVESVKAASDLYSPVSGKVIAVNDNAVQDPTLINSSAHTDGWLFKLELTDITELDKLLNAADYQKLIG